MIPTRLELRNFLAYRAPEPIVFHGIELACLAGQNGVGKSALFDAITWALWGKARAKRDDDLIHLGQKEMQVSLDFLQAGIRYRVLRRRALTGRGMLDLLVWGADESRPPYYQGRPASGARRTRSTKSLRLDFETFVHSAFLATRTRRMLSPLRQAAERKRILVETSRCRPMDGLTTRTPSKTSWAKSQSTDRHFFEHDIRQRWTKKSLGRPQLLKAKLDIAVTEFI